MPSQDRTANTAGRLYPALAALCLILVVAALLSVAMWRADAMPGAAAKTVAILFFLFSAPFLVLMHELGHLVTAVALGWRVPILSVGGFTLRFSPLRFSAGAPAFTGAAGAIVAVPPAKGAGRAGWAAVSAGGPAANLIVAALAAYAGLQTPSSSTPHAMFLVVAAISLFSGLYNLIPFGTRSGNGSDGLRILAALFGPDLASRGRYVRLIAQMIDGTRPRDWDPDLVRAVESDSIWSRDAAGQLLVYSWHLDRGEIDKARAVLRRAGRAADAVAVEDAFLLAFVDGKPTEARALMAKASHSWSARRTPSFWRAEAATCTAEGDVAGAYTAIRKWRLACADWPYATPDEQDWIGRIEARLAVPKAEMARA